MIFLEPPAALEDYLEGIVFFWGVSDFGGSSSASVSSDFDWAGEKSWAMISFERVYTENSLVKELMKSGSECAS